MKLATIVSNYLLLRRSTGMRFASSAKICHLFCRAMGDVDILDVTPDAVSAFLLGEAGLTNTWHRKYGALKPLYRFAIGRGYATTSPLPAIIPRLLAFTPYIYSIDELRRILAAVSILGTRSTDVPPSSVRTLILLLYGTGLRIGEALSLRFADVDFQNASLTIRDGKFYKDRLVPFGAQLLKELNAYARQRSSWPCDLGQNAAFFAMHNGRPLTKSPIEKIWRRLCDSANVRTADGATEKPRLHDLRHSFAVHRLVAWYREGADVQRLIYFLQVYLGHQELAYTQRYLTMTPELLGQANHRFEGYFSAEVKHV